MHQKIFDALKGLGVPVKHQVYKGSEKTYITFFKPFEQAGLFADNSELATEHYMQIDLWSKNDLEILLLYEKVRDMLRQNGMDRQDRQDFFENDTQTYHIAITIEVKEVL